jgi:hypothetical protein
LTTFGGFSEDRVDRILGEEVREKVRKETKKYFESQFRQLREHSNIYEIIMDQFK